MQTQPSPMFDLPAPSLAATPGAIAKPRKAEAAENGENPVADFAMLLDLSRIAGTLPGTAGAGSELPLSGKALPVDAGGTEAEAADTVQAIAVPAPFVDPALAAPVLPPTMVRQDEAKGEPAAVPNIAPAFLPVLTPVGVEALPDKPEEAKPLPGRPDMVPMNPDALRKLDLRIEDSRPAAQLPEQASARAVAVHAALNEGLRPGSARDEGKEPHGGKSDPLPVAGKPERPVQAEGSGDAATRPPARPIPAVEPVMPVVAAFGEPRPASDATPAAPSARSESLRADFATLVDRLVEARAALGGEPVRIALRHAEFGAVAMQLKPDDAGLSVTMASADPGFARAVNAAVPVIAAAAQANDATPQGDSGQARQQAAMSGQSETSGQQRGHAAPERRGEDNRQRAQHPQPRPNSGESRSGIFA